MVNSTNSHAHDQIEACLISQGLVAAELLVPVCLGYRQITDIGSGGLEDAFSDEKGYVYRYPSGSKRTGLFTLFGAPVSITVPRWVQVDGDGNVSAVGGKDNHGAPYRPTAADRIRRLDTSNTSSSSSTNSSSTTAGYVQYTIVVNVGEDRWEVLRRSSLLYIYLSTINL
jgi:hypothetical protein